MDLHTISSNGEIVRKNKMFDFYMDQKFVDTELILSDGRIKVHGIVLATESRLAFKLMKSQSGPQRTLRLTQYSKEVMRFVIEYIYRGTITYPRYIEFQIKSLIKFLQIEGTFITNPELDDDFKIEAVETNIKHEESVIEISDEEMSTDCSIIIAESASTKDKIQDPKESQPVIPLLQNKEERRSVDSILSYTTCCESMNEINIVESLPTMGAEPILDRDHCIESKSNFIPMDETIMETYFVSKENVAIIPNDFSSLTANTVPSQQPTKTCDNDDELFVLLERNECLANLRSIQKTFTRDEQESRKLPMEATQESTQEVANQDSLSKILVVSQHILQSFESHINKDSEVNELPTVSKPTDVTEQSVPTKKSETVISGCSKKRSNNSKLSNPIATTSNKKRNNIFLPAKDLKQSNPIATTSNKKQNNIFLPAKDLKQSSPIATTSNKRRNNIFLPAKDLKLSSPIATTSNKRRNNIFLPAKNLKQSSSKKTRSKKKLRNIFIPAEPKRPKLPKLSRKYCVLCDRLERHLRMHIRNHKKVTRNEFFICDKCFCSFKFEAFKNIHNCK